MRILRLLSSVCLIVAILGGCSLVRTGYEQADHLMHWWLDRRLDLDAEQSRWLKVELRSLLAWHRQSQLPAYADLLAAIARRSTDDVPPAQVCADIDSASRKLDDLLLQAVPLWAQLARQLSPAQLDHLRRKLDEEDREWREEWLDISPEKLFRKREDGWAERAESFYGRLSGAQKTFIRDAIRRSSWDPQLSWERRQLRRQQMLGALQKIRQQRLGQAEAEEELRTLTRLLMTPPDGRMVEMQRRLVDEACTNLSGLHQLASAAQRARARDKLLAYERDLRTLVPRR